MNRSRPMAERQSWWRGSVSPIISSSIAVFVALAIGGAVIAMTGSSVVEAFKALFEGAFGDRRAIGETIVSATPLILGGLAFAIAARAGMFNIGIEGQLVMGAFAAGIIATYDFGPRPLGIAVALIVGMAAGAVWGMIPGLLKAFSGAHEVITTIMLNYLALRIVSYAVNNLEWLPVNPPLQASDPALSDNRLPILLDGTRLHSGIVIAVVAALLLWWLLFRSVYGYKVRTVGISPGAAKYSGIPWKRTIVIAMVLSGLLAGLGGASETLGLQGRFYNVSPGYGFTAIAVGLVGRNHPIGVIAAGLLFGVLRSGATEMQNSAGVSKEIVQVLQGLVILAVAASAYLASVRERRAAARAAVSAAAPKGVEA